MASQANRGPRPRTSGGRTGGDTYRATQGGASIWHAHFTAREAEAQLSSEGDTNYIILLTPTPTPAGATCASISFISCLRDENSEAAQTGSQAPSGLAGRALSQNPVGLLGATPHSLHDQKLKHKEKSSHEY